MKNISLYVTPQIDYISVTADNILALSYEKEPYAVDIQWNALE